MPGLQLVLGDAAVPLAQHDAELAPGEVRTEAAVHAPTERQVTVHLTIEPHLERVGELGGVDVGRTDAHAHHVARLHRTTRDLGVFGAEARHAGHRRLPAQQLFDRGRDDRRVVDDLLPMRWVLGQVRERTRERVGDGVEPGEQEQEADVEDLFASELLAVDLGVEELGHDVVARFAAHAGRGSR